MGSLFSWEEFLMGVFFDGPPFSRMTEIVTDFGLSGTV